MDAVKWFKDLANMIKRIEVTTDDAAGLNVNDGFNALLHKTVELEKKRNCFFFVGNGASASIASHIAADFSKNGKLKTRVFTDLALITAVVNDIGVEAMFSEPLRQQASAGDMLVAISSSGNSPNILRAIEQAREMGLYIVTMTGMQPDNQARRVGDINFYLPAPDYGFAESGHAALLHFWVDAFLAEMESR